MPSIPTIDNSFELYYSFSLATCSAAIARISFGRKIAVTDFPLSKKLRTELRAFEKVVLTNFHSYHSEYLELQEKDMFFLE